MYLEIEIDHNRGSNKKFVTLKLEEDTDLIKMKFDRRPEFDIPDFRMLRKKRMRAQKKSDGSASFLRAARAGNLEKVLEFLKTNTDINTCNANGLNALHLASKEGHVHVVTELLQRGASVDAATKKGNTALHIASLAGQEEIVKVLVQHQALVNIQSQNGFTPLYMAAQENHDNVVRFLLANNANQSLATEDGFTPLAVALQQGHDKVVAVLLENDTRGKVRLPALHIAAKKDDTKAAALLLHTDHNPDVTSKSGFTPLHIAAHYGNENIANLLIQRGADVNYIAKHQITPLHVASKWGKGNMVSLLIDKGANYEAKTRDGLTPLHCAARSGHETVVDMLLEKGAPITSKTKNGLAPLHMASQGDHVDAARILLYHKAPVDDVTVDFLTALHVAAHCGHVRVAKLLLDRKADPNSRALNGFTPLHIACKKNRIKVVELLLKHGASIEATTESGLTPLHVASFMGCMNIVIYLIQHGASADVPTVRGETPLHLAARANQTDIIRILLRNGAQVDARAREQQTALHIASRLGNSDIVVLLLQHGAAVDATTKDHYTALHIAAKEGQEEVASVLLEHGASLTSTTKKGFTPLHLAAKYGNMKVARLLLQKDAPVDAQGKNGVTPLHVAAHYDHQNVALLLLDKGASPHATAKNGYTPLHIAARKNQMDIATTLLEYGASANAESKAGFTPLHLSSQEGHTDMATLLIEHNASPGACAKNGLTPLHLCAQEDRVNVAAILVKHGAQIDPVTKAGYTPLHVASHFGQMNMVRFLLQHGSKVDSTTQLGYTPLHQAAQQGHTQIVNLLLENKAEPNAETNDGKTALSIAQRLGYISVVETLKIVTETTITTTTTTVTEEKYKVVVPETMHETFMSESEDEGGDDNLVSSMFGKPQHVTLPYYEGQLRYTSDDTMLGDQSYRYLTVDEMKSLGDDSLPIDVTKDEKMDVSFNSMNLGCAPPVAPADQLSPQHMKEQHYSQFAATYPSDNVDIAKTPILAGFLVSFMVDARGGAMRGCRHSGVRVIIPPRKAAMPMRITCRYLKKDKLVHAPPLMEGEALASRILEMGPAGAKFLGPVIIEVPHFASLRGKEREIVILRSDNGETWREHTLEATEEAVQEVLNESFDGEELKQLEDLNTNRITRILTTDFPQYFAIVTRIRQEVHAIGPEGGMVSSTVVPQVQAVFPQGALTKKIKVGLQAQPIPTDLVAKLLGNRVAVSPIVTVEPRRRKFHKPITLTIPVPQASSKGMINQYSGEAPTLRLLCSITGGTTRAQWEDVTGSTPLTFVNDCVSFTTTVSARFWLMDCSNIPEATKMATELYREAIHVPFMAKFVVFSKRHQLEEARVRVFCMTDDREDKTLENQEMFIEVAKSRDVEVLEGKPQFLEFAGNLVPVTKSGDQLAFNFYAFRENRLPFTVRVKDQHADCIGRVAFMRQPKVGRGDPPQTPICNLNIALPDNIQPEPAPSEPDLLALEKKYSFLSISKADTIHKADLRLTDISNMLGTDWVGLARELEISDSDINIIKSQYPDNAPQQAIVMLRLWMQTSGNKANGNTLEKGLRKIGRDDIVNQCIFNVELVTDDIEKAMAKAHLDQSGFEAFREELGPSRDATLNRDISLDVSYDEQDMMKEAESAEEEEENQRTYHDKTSREQRAADMSPTYESEEKKYAGEEKIVAEEKVTKVKKDDSTVIATTTVVEEPDLELKKETVITEVKKEVIEEKKPAPIVTIEKVQEKMAEKVEEKVVEEKVEEKPIIDIEKHVEVVDKAQELKARLEQKASEAPPPSEKPEDKESTTATTKVIEGPDGSTTTTTTERRSFVTSDDGAVQEHIVIEKRTTSVVDGVTTEEDKSDILQRLGEELGRLDEKLEEKFKEKRKTEEPEEGFTQTSVEKSQMSSTRGTADVSTAGTTVTTVQHVGDTVMQAGQALIQQMSPQPADRRIAQEDALTHSKREQQEEDSTTAAARHDESKNGRTEERGCSPITVLEGRAAEGDAVAIRPLSRSGAHTITTTTSWGAPVSTTTSILLDDSKTDNCVQLTLHSESHVTLHAPGEIMQELKKVQQQDPSSIDTTNAVIATGKLSEIVDPLGDVQDVQEDSNIFSVDQQIPSNVDFRDLAIADSTEVEDSFLIGRKERESVYEDQVPGGRELTSAIQISVPPSTEETEVVSVGEAPQLISTVDNVILHDSGDRSATDAFLSAEHEEIQVTQSSLVEESKAVCDNSVVLSEDNVYAASESLAPSAHRPTTLMITSNSNESTDDAECTTNDPARISGENDKSQDFRKETSKEGMEMSVQQQGTGHATAGSERPPCEGGAVPRPERPSRPAPRTTTLVKVKVEKRPVGSHPQVRERSVHEHQTVVHVPSVEEEVRGLMQEVKEATSQIKQEVKELRQADTPTPDTPTPLREFREFLNREEEQEQERLPTIKEMCRESEEDTSSLNTGGEGLRGNEHLRLDLGSAVLERTTHPVQFVHHGFDESVHPDSGYSTLEGYYAVGTDPSITTKYIPSYNEPVPEGSSSEPSIKSELESPSSFVDSSDISPVESIFSATSPGNEKQGKSKFKSFMKKVRQLTSKGQFKPENRGDDSQGVEPQAKDTSREFLSDEGCLEGNWEANVRGKCYLKEQPSQMYSNGRAKLGGNNKNENISEGGVAGSVDFPRVICGDVGKEPFASVSSVTLSEDRSDMREVTMDKHKPTYSPSDIRSVVDKEISEVESGKDFTSFTETIESSDASAGRNLVPIIRKSELYEGKYPVECSSTDDLKQVVESPGSESLAISSPLAESPFSESSATGSQYTESLITEPSTSDHSPEGVAAFEMDSEHKKIDVEAQAFDFKSEKGLSFESSTKGILKPDYIEGKDKLSFSNTSITLPQEPMPEIGKLLKVSSPVVFREKDDDFDLSHKESGKLLETLIEEDETEDGDNHPQVTPPRSDIPFACMRAIERDENILGVGRGDVDDAIEVLSDADIEALRKSPIMTCTFGDEVFEHFKPKSGMPRSLYVFDKPSPRKESGIPIRKVKSLEEHKYNIKESESTKDSVKQRHDIGGETLHPLPVSEEEEVFFKAKELASSSPKYVEVITSIHQAEYPEKIKIGHKILETPFSHSIKMHQSIQSKTVGADVDFVRVTETASHVNDMEVKDEVDIVSEMHLTDTDVEMIHSTIHHDSGREDPTLFVYEKALCPQYDVLKAVQIKKVAEKERRKIEDAPLPEIKPERGHPTVHQDDDQKDFDAVTVSKEKIYHPATIENAVQMQEVKVELSKTDEMLLPDSIVEKASMIADKGQDPRDYGVADIMKTTICHQHDIENAVQSQETKAEIGKSENLSVSHIDAEKAFTTVDGDHKPFGVAAVSEPTVCHQHDVTKAVPIQETEEEIGKIEDLSFPYIDAEESMATIHEDHASKYFGVANVNKTTVCHQLDTAKAVQVQREMEEEGMTEEIPPLGVYGEGGFMTLHDDHDLQDVGALVVSEDMVCHRYDTACATQQQMFVQDVYSTEDMSVPEVHVENVILNVHRDLTSEDLGVALVYKDRVWQPFEIEKTTQPQVTMQEIGQTQHLTLPDVQHERVMPIVHQEADFGLAVISTVKVTKPYETQRIAQTLLATQEIGKTGDVTLPGIQRVNLMPIVQQESDFGFAVLRKDRIGQPYETQRIAQTQLTTQEMGETGDITLPDIQRENLMPTVHQESDLGVAVISSVKVTQPYETQSIAQTRMTTQEMGKTGVVTLPVIQRENIMSTVQQQSDFGVAIHRKDTIGHPYETQRRAQTQMTTEEKGKIKAMILPDIQRENIMPIVHQKSDLRVAVISTVKVTQPSETHRIAQTQLATQEMGKTGDVTLPDIQRENIMSTVQQESAFGVAIHREDTIGHPYETQRRSRTQMTTEEKGKIKDMILPDIQSKNIMPTVHQKSDLGAAVISTVNVTQAYETHKIAQSQITTQEVGKTGDVMLPDIHHENIMPTVQQESDFGVAIRKEDTISHPYETQRRARTQLTTEEKGKIKDMILPDIQSDNIMPTVHPESDFGVAVISTVQVTQPSETQRIAQTQLATQEMGKTGDVTLPDIQREDIMPTVQQESDFGIAVHKEDRIGQLYETHRRARTQITTEEKVKIRDMTLSDIQSENIMPTVHQKSDFGVADVSTIKVTHPYETQKIAQSQLATRKMGKTGDLIMPDIQHENVMPIIQRESDFGVAVVSTVKVSHPYETQRIAQTRLTAQEIGKTGDVMLPDIHRENVMPHVQQESDFGFAINTSDRIGHPYETHRRTQTQRIKQEIGKTGDLALPNIQHENVMRTVQQGADFGVAVGKKDRISYPYEAQRRAPTQLMTQGKGKSRDMMLPVTQHENVMRAVEQESDFGVAVVKKDEIVQPYETHRTSPTQLTIQELSKTRDMTLPDIQSENIMPSVHPESYLGVALVSKVKVTQPCETQRIAQTQMTTQEMGKTEDVTLPDIQHENIMPHVQEESDFGVAEVSTVKVTQPYETQRIAQTRITTQEVGKTGDVTLPDIQHESLMPVIQQESDFGVAVVNTVKVAHPYETHRIAQTQLATQEIGKTGDVTLPDIQHDNVMPITQQESNYVFAIGRNDKIGQPYDTQRRTQTQMTKQEIGKTGDLALPNIHRENVIPTVQQKSDFGVAVGKKDKIIHPYETQKTAQTRLGSQELSKTGDMTLPDIQHENVIPTVQPESEFGVAVDRKDRRIIHPYETQRTAQTQLASQEPSKTRDMISPDIHSENITPTVQQESVFGVAVARKDKVSHCFDIERKAQPQVTEEEIGKTEDMSTVVHTFEDELTTAHLGEEPLDFHSTDISDGRISHQLDLQDDEKRSKAKTSSTVHDEVISEDLVVAYYSTETIYHKHETQRPIQRRVLEDRKSVEKCIPQIQRAVQMSSSVSKDELCYSYETEKAAQSEDTSLTQETKHSDVNVEEYASDVSSVDPVCLTRDERTKDSNLSMEVISDDSLPEHKVAKTRDDRGLLEAKSSAKLEDRSVITKDLRLEEYYEAEQELAQIIHKQMEELTKDDEVEKGKETFISEVSETGKQESALSCLEVGVAESCEASRESESGVTGYPNDLEKIYVLDRVSDELRNMISSLEYNLAAGISKNIKITPILARLEQLEQEVANITKSSEVIESSIPLLCSTNITDSVVSSPQSVPLSVEGAEASYGEKLTSEDTTDITKMPVVLGNETADSIHLLGGQSPSGETNGVDDSDALTDVEDLYSDGDQSPMVKRKANLLVPQKDGGAVTDTEDMDFSGEEDELIQEKDLPTIQDLGLLPEPTREIINLTEGFARQPSPLLSGSESEVEDVEGRHKKNIKQTEIIDQETPYGELKVSDENDPEGQTDVEDMVASGDDFEEAEEVVEDSLPDHYMDQGEGISNKEKLNAVAPVPKVFLRRDDDSSDEEQSRKQKPRRKSKGGLKVEVKEEGTTDVEDLVFSDKGDDSVQPTKPVCDKMMEAEGKPKRKKLVRRKVIKRPAVSATLVTPTGDADALTDVEILTGDDEEEVEERDDSYYLGVTQREEGAITDSEDVEASDAEDVEALVTKPVEKLEPATLPPPHSEKVKISETEEKGQEESGVDTDEEGFELDDKDDERPLVPKKRVSYEPLETVEREALDVEEPCESALTDTEDFDMEEKDEAEILKDVESRIPEEGEIYTLREMENHMGRISKSEMIKDVDAELKQHIKEAELEGITLQEAMNDETLTDVEDLDDEGKNIKPKRKERKDDDTDTESVTESDIEEEIPKPTKQVRKKGKGRRLPLQPQISEVRFIETDQGPLSIIVTPDTLENRPGEVPKDQVANVVFLESEEEIATDVEDLGLSEDDADSKTKTALKTPHSVQEPTTDTEEIDLDPTELDRPLSPLPPNVHQDVFASPKREIIHIKEDKYGVPQVTIRKMDKNEFLESDFEDAGITDTEDIEVSEGEALRIIGVTEDDTSDYELPDGGKIEVSSRMSQREGLQVETEEEGGNTDVEELTMPKRQRRKPKSQSKLVPQIQEDSHTDVEILSDQDEKSNLQIHIDSPDAHTDLSDFETSEAEELEIPAREDAVTPDIIKNSAIKKVITMKEGPDGTVQTEESEIAPARKSLLQVEDESEGVTDVEDMEASGAEDEDPVPEYPQAELPSDEPSSVNISEKSSLPKSSNEAKLIKDNLLLPEDNYNNLTDVESLSEGEGNRCASNTSLLSSQQLTYAVESRTVAELSYYLPSTDPKLCVQPGVSLESDPFCGELTSPLVVEAELEQVYYHAPKEDAHGSEVELEASDGCVVRKRQVVASLCQAREIRRFWSLDRNSPLHQSEINAFAAPSFATPTIHKKGFKTILYLEQPNLLDTISISDTLCDSNYFKNERLRDFDSSSIDSFDDHFSYRDSDIITVVDQFNQERGSSSFDDLPSPHLSSISSTGIVDSLCSGMSRSPDPQCYDSLLCSSYSRCSSEDLRKESELTLSLSGISAVSCSPDTSLDQELELSSLDVGTNGRSREGSQSVCEDGGKPLMKQAESLSPSPGSTTADRQYQSTYSLGKANAEKDETEKMGILDKCSPVFAHTVSETLQGQAVEYHEGITTECIRMHASKHIDALAVECTEGDTLVNSGGVTTDCIKGFATECIETPHIESVEDIVPDYVEIDATSCLRDSPTGYVQRSITEWIVGRSTNAFEERKRQALNIHREPPTTCSQLTATQYDSKQVTKCLSKLTSESLSPPTLMWLKSPSKEYSASKDAQSLSKLVSPNIEDTKETKATCSSIYDTSSSNLLQSGEHSNLPLVDSGVHEYQTSGSFTTSYDKGNRLDRGDYESDHVSLADSVLGLDDQLDKEFMKDVDSVSYISAQYSPTLHVPSSQIQEENFSIKDFADSTTYPEAVVPPTRHHTLPRTRSQIKTEGKPSVPKMSGSTGIAKDYEEISKDFGGVKGLIDQWEVIVKEEQRKSLPASPAVGRKILPPFEGNKRASMGSSEGEMRTVAGGEQTKGSIQSNLGDMKVEDMGSFDGGSVIEEVASVCDIIQQFEGRVGRLGKMNAHRQRLPRGSQSPASRSPSHQRRVATVKPLCEPQLQQESSLPLQEGQMQQQQLEHQEQLQELLEHTVSAGFVPRVVESLSVTKCSNEIWEENPPQASVSNPEGTHEAAQIAEQQPTTISHDQGLDVEEMSNIMESYTSDGSDLITTTTHTTTSIDPDPITSTQTTRITRRTEIEDGEVKEDVYEEY